MNEIKVLLAEDHLITRQGICRLLEDEPSIKVIGEASNGEEAVLLAGEKQPDVVIMDIAMPRLNGIEATRQIKLLNPAVEVLILTAYDDDEYVFGLLEAGATGYLLKTTGGDELIKSIHAVYKHEPVLNPVIARKVIDRFRIRGVVRREINEMEPLTEREMEILKLAANGMGNKDIADKLHLSRRTVEGILRTIFNKMGVGSRVEAITQALRKGWFTIEEIPESSHKL